MKITKSRLKQIIKEEMKGIAESSEGRHLQAYMGQSSEVSPEEDAVPPEVALMEDLWDLVRGFYKAGRSDVALKLQKIAEMADEGHERLMPRGEGTPGLTMPKAPAVGSQDHQRRRFYKNRE